MSITRFLKLFNRTERRLKRAGKFAKKFKKPFHATITDNLIQICIEDNILESYCSDIFLISREVFLEEQYNINLKNDFVVFDIGMNIGCSSLYFSKYSNCKKVYGFEPVKKIYNTALKNFKNNSEYSNKIEFFNFGFSDEEKEIFIDIPEADWGSTSTKEKSEDEKTVKDEEHKVTLKKASTILPELINRHTESIILKIDCEGAEFDIFKDIKDTEILDNVSVILMEYHEKKPDEIVNILVEKGFTVFAENINKLSYTGMIRAVKRTL